jgi:hypothetical protein
LGKITDFFGKPRSEALHELHSLAEEDLHELHVVSEEALPEWQLRERSKGLHELHAVEEAQLKEQQLHGPSAPKGIAHGQNLGNDDEETLLFLLRLAKMVKDEEDDVPEGMEEDDCALPPKDEFPEMDDDYMSCPDYHEDGEEEDEYETRFGYSFSSFSPPSASHSPAAESAYRMAVDCLKSWTDNHNPYASGTFEPAMARSFASTLRAGSTDYFMRYLMSGSLPKSEALFDKSTWTSADFLGLSPIGDDKSPGVYGDIATGNIDHQTSIGCDLYIGYANNLHSRTTRHRAIKAAGLAKLEDRHEKSFHYSQICKPDVQSNFRNFMAFPKGTPNGIPQLGEGIWMIFVQMFKYPGYCSTYALQPAYRLCENTIFLIFRGTA